MGLVRDRANTILKDIDDNNIKITMTYVDKIALTPIQQG